MTDPLGDARVVKDELTVAFVVEVPRSQIVLLQVFFELYDGVGTIRTLDVERGVVCVMTTPSLEAECRAVLMAIRDQVAWIPYPDWKGLNLVGGAPGQSE